MSTFDPHRVVEKYGRRFESGPGVLYPPTEPSELVIHFTCMHTGRFDRLSWFWNDEERWHRTAHLFLNDDDLLYYLGSDDSPKRDAIRRVIHSILKELGLSPDRAVATGTSMGGYAAIFHTIYSELAGAIVGNPQVDRKSASKHKLYNWERQIAATGRQWIDLEDFIHKARHRHAFYVIHGDYPADVAAVSKFMADAHHQGHLMVLERRTDGEHSVPTIRREDIVSGLDFVLAWSSRHRGAQVHAPSGTLPAS